MDITLDITVPYIVFLQQYIIIVEYIERQTDISYTSILRTKFIKWTKTIVKGGAPL